MREIIIKAGALRHMIKEDANEFRAKLGSNVERDNKSENQKAYSDNEKRMKEFNPQLKPKVKKYEKPDNNKGLMDYNIDGATPEYKKRVHAQVDGYNSVAEKESKMEREGDYEGNEAIYQGLKKAAKDSEKEKMDFKRSGLQARELPEKTFERDNMYEAKAPIKTIYFKKTEFISENHMFSKIPDDFKTEGAQFKMRDMNGNEYLLEWTDNKPVILEHKNEKGLNEAISRMQELFNYKSSDTKTTTKQRFTENDNIKTTIDAVRKFQSDGTAA